MRLISLILSIGYLPHALFYKFVSKEIRQTISEDIRKNITHLYLQSPINESRARYVGVITLAVALQSDAYLRTLYFHRLKRYKLRYLLWGRHSSFIIPYDVTVGAGVKLDHPYSTILNAKSIGRNLRIKNNVTIGNKNDDENLRPVIGDNVYIGAGAIIIGNITIGDNVTIGAGTVAVKSIPANSIAVGNPARIIKK